MLSHPSKAWVKWHLSEREAQWSLAVVAAFNVFGMGLRFLFGVRSPQMPDWPLLASIGFGLFLLLCLGLRRAKITGSLASVLFVINATVVATALFLVERELFGIPGWVPFRPNQLGCLVAALVAPTMLAGILAIAAHAGSALLLLWSVPQAVTQEPLATIAFASAGVFVLVFRFRQLALRDQMQKAQAESEAVRDLARSFLQVRDLMNTPLQTLELALSWLGKEEAVDGAILSGANQALEQLRSLNQELRRFETAVDWKNAGP